MVRASPVRFVTPAQRIRAIRSISSCTATVLSGMTAGRRSPFIKATPALTKIAGSFITSPTTLPKRGTWPENIPRSLPI